MPFIFLIRPMIPLILLEPKRKQPKRQGFTSGNGNLTQKLIGLKRFNPKARKGFFLLVKNIVKTSIDNAKVKCIMELYQGKLKEGFTMTDTMRRAERLIATLTFEDCITYLENNSETSLDFLILDRIEELDKARFIEFSKTF
ncbi:MAG: hypothetical protein EOM76_12365 [Sphingobacteriia bacterium]|nr:hypothetical protein [Sphingobacteriia bacterium]